MKSTKSNSILFNGYFVLGISCLSLVLIGATGCGNTTTATILLTGNTVTVAKGAALMTKGTSPLELDLADIDSLTVTIKEIVLEYEGPFDDDGDEEVDGTVSVLD